MSKKGLKQILLGSVDSSKIVHNEESYYTARQRSRLSHFSPKTNQQKTQNSNSNILVQTSFAGSSIELKGKEPN